MTTASKYRLVKIVGDDPDEFFEHSGLKRESTVPDSFKPWMKYHEFEVATTVEKVNWIVDQCILSGRCSLDLETEGLDNRIWYDGEGKPHTVHQIVSYCISYDGHTGWSIPVRHKLIDDGSEREPNVRPLKEVEAAIERLCRAAIPVGTPEAIEADPLSYKCERPKLVIYFWNAQFDQEFLYPITGIDWWHPDSFEDGMLACFCIYAGDKHLSLKDKAEALLRDPDGNPYEMIKLKDLFFGKSKNIRFASLAPDEPGVRRYTGSDAICTFKLCEMPEVVPLALAKHRLTYRIEKQVTCALRIMERSRVRINRDQVRVLLAETVKARDALLKSIVAFAAEHGVDLDPKSPKQLSQFLFDPKPKGLDITPKPDKLEKSGQYKTDGSTLEGLAKSPHAPAILKDIVRFRELDKFIGTYLTGLANNPDENNEIRASFKQTGAASGRFSAPNGKPEHGYAGVPMHGIPGDSDLRRYFEARYGYTMVKADYSGEELRIAANITGEPIWLNEFLHGSGDLHSITARAFFGRQDITKEERNAGKIANFTLIYGGGPQAIMAATGCSMMEAKRRKLAFDKSVPVFTAWIKDQKRKVKDRLGVRTAFGRWLALPDANSPDPKIQAAVERHAVNYQIQGAGADIMKIALVMLTKKFHRLGWLRNGGDDSVRMLLTVHDEVVFEIRNDRVVEAVPVIVDTMEYPTCIPQPAWKVPLVVEPLIGYNWKSGYAAERAKSERRLKPSEIDRVEEGIPLRKYEVLRNGFVYSTTREPKRDKKTREIVETLDRDEVREGDDFRILNPPWLEGAVLPPPPTPVTPPEEPARAPAVEQVETPALMAAEASEDGPLEEFGVRLLFNTRNAGAQVAKIIKASRDERGPALVHLFDRSGKEPIIPQVFRVKDKEEFIHQILERNLGRERSLR